MILIGHRGAKAHSPENTIAGFSKGVKLGANSIEFDIRFTKDSIPIVIHDATVDRTTNGKGKVSSFNLNELRKLNAGNGEKIPTLKEALMFCKKQKVTPLVELKEKKHTKIISDTIKQTKTNPIILSFYPEALKQFKTHAPNIETAFLFSNKIKNTIGFMKLGKALRANWLFGRKDIVDKKLIETAHKWKFKIAVWVCNTKKDISKFKKLGVDGIATDKPELF